MALDLNDKSGNSNTLTNNNAVSEVTASLAFSATASAADFEAGSSQSLTAADSASLSITGDLTIELWIKLESTPSAGNDFFFVNKTTPTGNQRSYSFSLNNTGGTLGLRFFFSDDGTFQAANEKIVAWTPSTGTWYHVAVTFKASTSKINFYVDGALHDSEQTASGTAIFDSTAGVALGAFDASSPSAFFDGIMDDVRIWSAVRTATEISENKDYELAGSESNLEAYWPFEATLTPKPGEAQAVWFM